MTPDELSIHLEDQELSQTVDIKTLVIDLVRRMELDEIQDIFWKKLPELSLEDIKGYFYMKRG
jgi:hypothetical protein